jgi:Zn-dependent protease with chaperone function
MSRKDDKSKDSDAAAEAGVEISIGNHPRAKASIRRTRTGAALCAFVVVLLLGLTGGQTTFDAVWRALLAGVVVNIVAWRVAIAWWRQIIINEVRVAGEQRAERMRAAREEAERRAAAQQEQQRDNPGFRTA